MLEVGREHAREHQHLGVGRGRGRRRRILVLPILTATGCEQRAHEQRARGDGAAPHPCVSRSGDPTAGVAGAVAAAGMSGCGGGAGTVR